MSRNNILWLASWYPGEVSPYDGDFIQRHARAASLLNNITVIFVKKDTEGTFTNNKKTVVKKTDHLTEIIIYYRPPKTGISIIDRLLSRITNHRIYNLALKKHIAENGPPELLHVHVALNVTRQALWLKRKYGMPLVISEHWTGYLRDAKPNLENYHPIYKKWMWKIFDKADAVTTVSAVLGEAIKQRFEIPPYRVIPNVVDTAIFFPTKKQPSVSTRFIHISLLNFQKNPQDIIEAFALLQERGYDFTLLVYGHPGSDLLQLVRERKLDQKVNFKGEVPQKILATEIQQADALVLYSRYETFGCVVIEANACGVPAILSDLPVFREYVIENETGAFAKLNDPESLAAALADFIHRKEAFVQSKIAEHTRLAFAYEPVAKQFDDLYKALLSKP